LGEYSSYRQFLNHARSRARQVYASVPTCLGGGNDKAGAASPVWMRDYSIPPNRPGRPQAQRLLNQCLTELQADRMVVGHTVQSRINAAFHGKAWRVDTGASQGVAGGTLEILEVVAQSNGDESVSILTERGRIPAAYRFVENIASSFIL
jgi:hypothetical protein